MFETPLSIDSPLVNHPRREGIWVEMFVECIRVMSLKCINEPPKDYLGLPKDYKTWAYIQNV